MTLTADLAAMAAALEASDDYRVLRRLSPRPRLPVPADAPTRIGLFVDVETTGLDPKQHEIIELAMIPFRYGLDGVIYEVLEPFHGFRQPSGPIPPEITALTGIDDAMVAGQSINPDAVAAAAAPAALIIAHNAGFDRRFLERFCATFTTKPWACSMREVDWSAEGHEGAKLVWLAAGAGFFYDRHRATNDCLAAIELLATEMQRSKRTALSHLLERARASQWRIWAQNSPFAMKDRLKERGYRWSGDDSVPARCWYTDVGEERKDAEMAFLREEIYGGEVDLLTRRIDAFDRFSDRC
ncbi:3'-5' exonuclease [Caulobacter segnis]|uniref:Exonuclease RNase T and DNA polymerase III n=2 Tax=Caulobacter segnis TaxID=88688 RepID=D5VLN6_CAUST|nr:3'-5' exonuclease [Caulobacter segnis]ADG11409.1 Exonuclease RNase T and DNA polymerase III [Caulobacter segnis ATCC 21756]AVQ03076.1 3'-5' exonuclease [Caulobacter segnis]